MRILPYLALCMLLCAVHNVSAQTAPKTNRELEDSIYQSLRDKANLHRQDSIAKQLTPTEGKAIVYIVRPTIVGFAVPMRLDVDSFIVGWIPAKGFLYTELPAGEHTFKAHSENDFSLKVMLEAGKIYYLEQEVKMGFAFARTKLRTLETEKGKKELDKCTLSKRNRYPLFPLSADEEKDPVTE